MKHLCLNLHSVILDWTDQQWDGHTADLQKAPIDDGHVERCAVFHLSLIIIFWKIRTAILAGTAWICFFGTTFKAGLLANLLSICQTTGSTKQVNRVQLVRSAEGCVAWVWLVVLVRHCRTKMRTESTKYVYPYVRCKIRAFVTRIIGNSATRPATKAQRKKHRSNHIEWQMA